MTYKERKILNHLLKKAIIAFITDILTVMIIGIRLLKTIFITLFAPTLCGLISVWCIIGTTDEYGRISGELLVVGILITTGWLISNIQHYIFGYEWEKTLAFGKLKK